MRLGLDLRGSGLDARGFFAALWRRWGRHDVGGHAAQLSFYFLFSLFPFLLFLAALLAFLPLREAVETLIADLRPFVPDEAMRLVEEHLRGLVDEPRPSFLTLSLLGTIYSAARGVRALINALNLAYDVRDSRSRLRVELLAIAFTVSLATLLLSAMSAMLIGGDLGHWLAERAGVDELYALVWSMLRWPVTAILVMLALAIAYYVLPDVRQEFRFITPGSVLGTILWSLMSWAFTQYVEHFGNFNVTYGSIGGVIILLMWFYLSALILIIGGEINAILEEASTTGKPRGSRAPDQPPLPPEERPHAAVP